MTGRTQFIRESRNSILVAIDAELVGGMEACMDRNGVILNYKCDDSLIDWFDGRSPRLKHWGYTATKKCIESWVRRIVGEEPPPEPAPVETPERLPESKAPTVATVMNPKHGKGPKTLVIALAMTKAQNDLLQWIAEGPGEEEKRSRAKAVRDEYHRQYGQRNRREYGNIRLCVANLIDVLYLGANAEPTYGYDWSIKGTPASFNRLIQHIAGSPEQRERAKKASDELSRWCQARKQASTHPQWRGAAENVALLLIQLLNDRYQ